MVRLGESGSGGAKATERPMCKESCKEKGQVWEGWSDQGNLALAGGTKATEKPMHQERYKEKGQVSEG